MSRRSWCVLQVNTTDICGGAERVAWSLFQAGKRRGFSSWLAIGRSFNNSSLDSNVFLLPNDAARSRWARLWLRIGQMMDRHTSRVPGLWRLRGLPRVIGEPVRSWKTRQGWEDFDYPGTSRILGMLDRKPDIIHCHNLHGGYFDLRCLTRLGQQCPIMVTLHDAWLLSGHCAHSFECKRWQTGCGDCPDLTIYPAIRRDATACNWQRKKQIYSKSKLYLTVPSRWLMEKVERSMLTVSVQESRILPHGVDLSIFHPVEDRSTIRATLGLPSDAVILLFAASSIRTNMWKDYGMIRNAMSVVAERLRDRKAIFIALGETSPAEHIGSVEIRFVPYQEDPHTVADYYRASDVYLHAARAEVWGLTITEAMACGTPVVATAMGGIPEQIEEGVTGFLVAPGDSVAMADRVVQLANDKVFLRRIGQNAAEKAHRCFDLNRQVNQYFDWYEEILEKWKGDGVYRGVG